MTQAHDTPLPWNADDETPPTEDALVRFLLHNAPVRGEAVSLDHSWRAAMAQRPYPTAVRRLLGELCAAGLLLSASLKFDGTLILQIHGDGPVALLVVECDAQGHFRATAKLREGASCPDDADLASLVNLNGQGRFVMTLNPPAHAPATQPYQGIVALTGRTVAEVLEHSMTHSEQVPTRLWLAADDQRAVGVLLQKLPEHGGHAPTTDSNQDLDGWQRLQQLAETLTRDELLAVPYLTVVHRLFWQEPLHAWDSRPLRFTCRCSRAKVGNMLKMLGQAEIASLLAEQGTITVHCEFCCAPYGFDAVDSARLFLNESAGPDSQARH